MPVGNVELCKIKPSERDKIGITEAHVRYAGRKRLNGFDIIASANTAVVTTQNQFCAAPAVAARIYR